jgi:hypothetical protein
MRPSQVASQLRKIAATIDASKLPRPDLVAQDLRQIIAILMGAPAGPRDELEKKIWDFLYGRQKPWSYSKWPEGVDPEEWDNDLTNYLDQYTEEAAGSMLFWWAFEELDIVDWSPVTDPEEVIKKTREMSEKLRAQGQAGDPQQDEDDARRNWETYRDEYMEEDVKKLIDAGIIGPDDKDKLIPDAQKFVP